MTLQRVSLDILMEKRTSGNKTDAVVWNIE